MSRAAAFCTHCRGAIVDAGKGEWRVGQEQASIQWSALVIDDRYT